MNRSERDTARSRAVLRERSTARSLQPAPGGPGCGFLTRASLLPYHPVRTALSPPDIVTLTFVAAPPQGERVDVKDLIMVSVDAHVVDPANLFEGRLSAK